MLLSVSERNKSTNRKVPTLRLVAKAAGVSTATVSKALNGIPVSEKNLERVLAAAERLGYVPNDAARSMRGIPSMTVGMVMHLDLHPGGELMTVLHSMMAEIERLGYTVLISVTRGDPHELDTVLRRFIERRVDGLFYWNAQPSKSLALYRQLGIPVLAVGFRSPQCDDLPLITVDSAPTTRLVSRRLRALGHQVALEITTHGAPELLAPRSKGGVCWQRTELGFNLESVVDLVKSLRSTPDSPTVIVANYPTALQILEACEGLQIRVPEDLSVVSTLDGIGAALLRTSLSAIRTDYERLGQVASATMLRAISREPINDEIVPKSVQWVERQSTGSAPPAGAAKSPKAPVRRSSRTSPVREPESRVSSLR
jgi:LacI family transcriptional regulator